MVRPTRHPLLLWPIALTLAACPADAPSTPSDDPELPLAADADVAPAPTPDVTQDAAGSPAEPDAAPDAAVADVEPAPPHEPIDWSVVTDGYAAGALLSVWSGGADDVWLVGGELHAPLVLHLGPEGWEGHDPGTAQQAWWVHGFEDGPVVIVGDGGSIARFEGGAWADESPGLPGATLYGVWGDSPESLWAVGGPSLQAAASGATAVTSDVLLRLDDAGWHEVTLPDVDSDRAGQSLFKVWGSARDDVYVVGSQGLILHYDGAVWTPEPVEGVTSVTLFTVTGRGPDDVWAVGGGAHPVLLHRDDAGWAQVELPEYTPQILQGVWTAPGHPLYLAGAFGFTARLDPGGWHEPDPGTSQALHAIGADPSGGVWAVGGTILTLSPDYDGTVLVAGREVPALELAPVDPEPAPEPVPDASDGGTAPDTAPDAVEEVIDDAIGPEDVGPDTVADAADASDILADVSDTGDTSPEPSCGVPDVVCPEEGRPYPGAPCEGHLQCDYDNGTYSTDHFECEDGTWTLWTECYVPGCSTLPPFAETCDEPFDGHVTGDVAITLGPAVDGAPYAPFEAGEQVPVEWGPQGLPMVGLRLGISGADELTCVQLKLTTELEGVTVESSVAVQVRCGETLRIYLVLPVSPLDCAVGEVFELTVDAKVGGVGAGSATITVEGGGAWWCG